MDSFIQKLLNVLLFPTKLYGKLTDKKASLYVGIILVGLIDLFSTDFVKTYTNLFTGKPNSDIQFNIALAIIIVLVLGIIDVVFFSIPLYDIFKYFKKKDELPHEASPVKIMKTYILSHFLFMPVNIVIYYTLLQYVNENSSPFMINLSIAFFFLILIWISAIVTRGINTIFNFNPLFRRFTFIIVFTWNFLLSMVLDLKIMNWLMNLFR